MMKKISAPCIKSLCCISLVMLTFAGSGQNYYGTNFAAPDDAAHNTVGNIILIDYASINGDSTAIILETPSTRNLITASSNFSSCEAYDYSAEKWTILNETTNDNAIPTGMKFNILNPSANGTAFQYISDSVNYSYFADLDNPATNGKPGALVFIRHVWILSDNSTHILDSIPVGVWYNPFSSKWSIMSENSYSRILPNTSYNVFVADTTGGRAFIHTTTAADTSANLTYISNPLIDGDSNAVIIVTHNYSPGGTGTAYDSAALGLYYDGRNWAIYHQNHTHMHMGVSYNVLVASATGPSGVKNIPADEVDFALSPNPASDHLTISYTLTGNSDVSVKLYSADGREIDNVHEGKQTSGSHTLRYDVSVLQNGSYYAVLSTDGSRVTHPVLIMK